MILAFLGTILGLTINLSTEARVRGQEISLGEIATVSGDDANLVQRVRALNLGYTPMPGLWRAFPRWQIEQKLRAELPGESCIVVGAETSKIWPLTTVVRAADITSAADRELRGFLVGRDFTIKLEQAQRDLEVPLADGARELKVALERRVARAGAWQVPVQVWVDSTLFQTVFVPFQVELYENLPVLTHDIRRGEVMGANSIELRRTKLATELVGRPVQAAAALGATAARDLGRGAILLASDLERVLVVRKGETVQIVIQKGSVAARSTAVASQDGYVGDRIKVVTADRKKELVGVVRGKDGVLIDLGSNR